MNAETTKKRLALAVTFLLVCVAAILCHQTVSRSMDHQLNKTDLAELNHIQYGLFSVNSWKEKLQVIVIEEINGFNLSKANAGEIKQQIEGQLSVLIDKVYERIRESNKGSFKGGFKQSLIDTFVDVDEIKKGVPEYADTIIAELSKSQNERKLKRLLRKGVTEYFEQTFDAKPLTKAEQIIEKWKARDIEQAREILREEILKDERFVDQTSGALILLAVLVFALAAWKRSALGWGQFIPLVAILLILLLAGVMMPMIDMEAKISELSFVLMDHPVKFADQILYFQSKSIMDVFLIMIVHEDLKMKAVGVLMVSFSLIFPVLKLISSVIYHHNLRGRQNNKWIQFFVLKSGKWSMADVLVVAIFMAYIGFNGIITSQLEKLSSKSEEVMMIVTNGTSLQPGFYVFFTFAVLALIFSGFLLKEKESLKA